MLMMLACGPGHSVRARALKGGEADAHDAGPCGPKHERWRS